MLSIGIVLFVASAYLGVLFAMAYIGDKRAESGKSIISNSWIYALSLAVYCTAWTFYGSVGRAAVAGPKFLPIYLGPTLAATLGWLVWRKMLRISKIHRITSIADFIASRYGKSATLGGVVAIIAVVSVLPYIALQLKAIATSFFLITRYPTLLTAADLQARPFFGDTAFFVAMLLAAFAILFGTRNLDVTERHEGLVAAIALESIVKLLAFLAVGIFVTYGIYDGLGDLFRQAAASVDVKALLRMPSGAAAYSDWCLTSLVAMLAVLTLPRQFQVTVVENVNERHLSQALWLFPLYMLAINIFVLPVALGGLMHFSGRAMDADWFVLSLPMAMHQKGLALLVFIGGMSAATGMVIVETIALSTMICNELVMPVLLRLPMLRLTERDDLSSLLLIIRRISILMVLALGYMYFQAIGSFFSLVSIGLVSFTAVAQFSPSLIGGLFWKGGTRAGALAGLLAGFGIWGYTLVLPSLAEVGLLDPSFILTGPFNQQWLRPHTLFGLDAFTPIGHAVFWSLLVNISAYIGTSLYTRPSELEHTQAALFVDVFKYSNRMGESALRRGTASVPALRLLLERFLGPAKAATALDHYAKHHPIESEQSLTADSGLINYAQTLLGGAIGAASAHVILASVVKEEPLSLDEVMGILDETRQVIAYSRELEKATDRLKAANERLQEVDRLKDEFIATVTHELRTPLTSIRSLAEIINTTPNLVPEKKDYFSSIIIAESERLTRLISQVLDIQKIESGRIDWQFTKVDPRQVVHDALMTTGQLISEKRISLDLNLPDAVPYIDGDLDRLIQVMVNLISNAVKFSDQDDGRLQVRLTVEPEEIQISVKDNGIGISRGDLDTIFERFQQVRDVERGRPAGSGLGLSITKSIIEFHNGRIWVNSKPGKGSTFYIALPVQPDSPWIDVSARQKSIGPQFNQ